MRPDFNIPLEKLQALPAFHQATITEAYLDRMGHMNVRHYLGLFDDGAMAFFHSFGMTEAYFTSANAGGFALQHLIFYLAEVRAGETVSIRPRMIARSAKRIHTVYFMLNETRGVLAAVLEALGSHADLNTRRTSAFPDHISTQIDAIITDHSRLDWAAPVSGIFKV